MSQPVSDPELANHIETTTLGSPRTRRSENFKALPALDYQFLHSAIQTDIMEKTIASIGESLVKMSMKVDDDEVSNLPQNSEDPEVLGLYHVREAARLLWANHNAKIEQHINAFAAPRCLSLCRRIQDTLPREIRDIIYSFLLQDGVIEVHEDDVQNTHFPEWDLEEWHDEAYGHFLLGTSVYTQVEEQSYSHLIKGSFVDPITRYEFAEAWYRENAFSFQNIWLISKFLAVDRWGFGVDPRQLVRRVVLKHYESYGDNEELSEFADLNRQTTFSIGASPWIRCDPCPLAVAKRVKSNQTLELVKRLQHRGFAVSINKDPHSSCKIGHKKLSLEEIVDLFVTATF